MTVRPLNSVFIGGRQIGANCLRVLVDMDAPPQLVIPDPDDVGVDSWFESLVKVAKELSLPTLRGARVKDESAIKKIRALKPDIIFCIGSMQLIPKEVLAIPPLGVVNIHPALLPKYRGRYSTAHAIFNGEKETGATLHFMDERIDSGPIIMQEAFPIGNEDTARVVYDKFTEVGTALFKRFVESLKRGEEIASTPQDESKATYYPKGLPSGGKMDPSWDEVTKKRFVLAMTFPPFPMPDID
ncbi:hypothetical protein A3A39_03000 [Candidatus Kaiserbacteria bacterium RIFCSPLOWO2_01_FULL_54_13]|uniref:Formyl transferase N-terminal domain-containing protein n=1 Tax=Candidatus Kaiserbacteria bacterium RIFCSPLOWO2_01_FULL_54_13 TaxID=1798512 RepID=A0A1F6F2E0_9BACT|nr:MAG: hypothetical protein A3A39_03000 [Candidatus Kaiserbacteria bacterium RIFCSPLOWO2_01_FULL_54_13]